MPWRSGCNCHGYQLVLSSLQSASAGPGLSSSESHNFIYKCLHFSLHPHHHKFQPFFRALQKSTHTSHVIYFNEIWGSSRGVTSQRALVTSLSPISVVPSNPFWILSMLLTSKELQIPFLYGAPSPVQELVLSLPCNNTVVVTLM